jgi:hypothetical protein
MPQDFVKSGIIIAAGLQWTWKQPAIPDKPENSTQKRHRPIAADALPR